MKIASECVPSKRGVEWLEKRNGAQILVACVLLDEGYLYPGQY